MQLSSPCLVFTDLDGSLLDHHTYSFDPAKPVLEELEDKGIPVIAVSSKTRSEIEAIRKDLNSQTPFIVENGAAVFIPQNLCLEQPEDAQLQGRFWVKTFSSPRSRWLQVLADLELEFKGEFDYFYRAGSEGIAAMTGLPLEAATLANQREFSEPVQWLGSATRREEFIHALKRAGANPLQGGRFLTVSGSCDKGKALQWLRDLYLANTRFDSVHCLAVGDSGNDVAMLEVADTALLIRSPVHDFPAIQRSSGVIKSTEYGPQGWAQGVTAWLAAQQ